jgi:hypothetical protein
MLKGADENKDFGMYGVRDTIFFTCDVLSRDIKKTQFHKIQNT